MPGPTTCTFANTLLSRGFDFTFSPGVQPSVCMLATVPHTSGLPSVGELRFQTAGESPFVFRDCLLEEPRLTIGDGGQHWHLPIKDRRWRWQFGYIHGSYNLRQQDGSYLRERSPQQLATLLLAAMGETLYDVSQLPNDARPEVSWSGANPAGELDRLCGSLACVIVYNPFSDGVELWRVGASRAGGVPVGPTRGSSYAPAIPAQPQHIIAEAAPTLFQATFQLQAVGRDTDGAWKPLDSLSYRPTDGWKWVWPPSGFQDVTGTYTAGGRTLPIRDLANATVFRCYQISGLAQGGWVPPLLSNTPYAPAGLQDYRLFDHLVEETVDSDGSVRRAQAVAYVRHWRDGKATPSGPTRYDAGFSFDAEHGIVSFNEPVFLRDRTTTGVLPADVRFECAFHAGFGGVMHRHTVTHNLGGAATKPRLVQRPDIAARVIYQYANDQTYTTTDDLADTGLKLGYWAAAAATEYGQRDGASIHYQKLMPVALDGLAQQVTWSGGGGRPATTMISWAQRHKRYIRPLAEQRSQATIQRLDKEAKAITAEPEVLALDWNRKSTIQDGSGPGNPYPLVVANVSGEVVPPYAVMKVSGVTGTNADTVYSVVKPPAGEPSGQYIVNSPVAIPVGGHGSGTTRGPVVAAYNPFDGTPVSDSEWGVNPLVGGWYLSALGKGYKIIGGVTVDGDETTVRVAVAPAGTPTGDDFPLVRIYNDSGLDKPFGAIVGYGAPLDPPPTTLHRIPSFKSIAPQAGKPFAVLLAPGAANQIADAGPLGVVAVKINYTNAAHTHADAITNDYDKLQSGMTGPAHILWRELQSIAGAGTLGVQWARVLLKHDNYRSIRGKAYTSVTSEDARFQIHQIVPLAGSLDPRTDPADPTEKIWVANYPENSYAPDEDVYADYIGPNTDPDASWEALPKASDGASGTFVCTLAGTMSAGTTSAMGPGTGTVYSISGSALISLGSRDIYNPFAIALPSSSAGDTILYTCAKTGDNQYTITGIDPLHLLAFLSGFAANTALYSNGAAVENMQWGGGTC